MVFHAQPQPPLPHAIQQRIQQQLHVTQLQQQHHAILLLPPQLQLHAQLQQQQLLPLLVRLPQPQLQPNARQQQQLLPLLVRLQHNQPQLLAAQLQLLLNARQPHIQQRRHVLQLLNQPQLHAQQQDRLQPHVTISQQHTLQHIDHQHVHGFAQHVRQALLSLNQLCLF
jgi:hypothetical protein